MRSFLLASCFLFLNSGWLSGQSAIDDSVTERLNQYFQATEAQDWDGVIDLLYPRLFELAPKEDMRQTLADMNGNGISLEMSGFEIKRISAPLEHEEERFAKVDYSGKMRIKFTSEAYQTPEMVGALTDNFNASYGPGQVRYEIETGIFHISVNKSMYAIAQSGTTEWYFIDTEGEAGMMEQIIPAAVLEHTDF